MAANAAKMAQGLLGNVTSKYTAVSKKVMGVVRRPTVQSTLNNIKNELGPPPPAAIPGILQSGIKGLQAEVMNIGSNTVKEAAVKGLIVVEVGCWFYIGEIIGRRSLFGYKF